MEGGVSEPSRHADGWKNLDKTGGNRRSKVFVLINNQLTRYKTPMSPRPLRWLSSAKLLLGLSLASVAYAQSAAALVHVADGVSLSPALTEYLNQFATAVPSGDASALPEVAENFQTPNALVTHPRAFFPRAVERLGRGLSEIRVASVAVTAAGTEVRVVLGFGAERVARTFVFDRAARLVSADFIFDTRTPLAPPQRVSMPDRVELPFQLRNNLPFVEAEVDGQRGLFFFDTGASRITLNEKYFAAQQKPGEVAVARGARGEDAAKRARVGRFSLGNYSAETFECALADLSTLEQNGAVALGLIGYEALKDFEVAFDYARKVVVLYALDDGGATRGAHDFGSPALAIPFEQEGHLPVVAATIGGQPARLALDSGASGGTLDLAARARLGAALTGRGTAMLGGMGGRIVQRELVSGDLRIGELNFPAARFVCNDYSHFRTGGAAWDGIIGYQVLSSRRSAINYRTRQLKFW